VRRFAAGLILAGAALLALCSGALAGPKPDGSYAGQSTDGGVTLNFRVLPSAKRVADVNVDILPADCTGGPTPARVVFKGAPIRKNKFAAPGKEYDFANDVVATAILRGKFINKQTVKGVLKVSVQSQPSCNTTTSYQAALLHLPG